MWRLSPSDLVLVQAEDRLRYTKARRKRTLLMKGEKFIVTAAEAGVMITDEFAEPRLAVDYPPGYYEPAPVYS